MKTAFEITENIHLSLKIFLNENNFKPIILVDENTKKHCLPFINLDCPVIEIKSGEANKTIETAYFIFEELFKLNTNKKHCLICLGGGVLCDIGGFVATTFKRGIHFIHVPTTLLAMVDACVGGKNGVNFNHLKNMIGTFNLPNKVIVYNDFLKTLSNSEMLNGKAEMLKIAIVNNQELFLNLKGNDFQSYIKNCIEEKNKIVSEDFKDNDRRQILNFGHTIGHAIEAYYLEVKKIEIPHGKAITKGMIMELKIALELKVINQKDYDIIIDSIQKNLPYELFEIWIDEILPFLKNDKKNTNKKIVFSLPNKVGSCITGIELTASELKNILK